MMRSLLSRSWWILVGAVVLVGSSCSGDEPTRLTVPEAPAPAATTIPPDTTQPVDQAALPNLTESDPTAPEHPCSGRIV
jgi:hypothetical protein